MVGARIQVRKIGFLFQAVLATSISLILILDIYTSCVIVDALGLSTCIISLVKACTCYFC